MVLEQHIQLDLPIDKFEEMVRMEAVVVLVDLLGSPLLWFYVLVVL